MRSLVSRATSRRFLLGPCLLLALGSCSHTGGLQPSSLPDPLAAGWQGESVCEGLAHDLRHRILRCTFPPGVGHERHFHAPHFGYVLVGGRMQITDAKGTRVVDLANHSTWESDGVAWHEVVNVGDTTSIYLIVEPLD